MSEKYDYDAIIIGAGIGGLVCGCYLAKAGLKTLIVEKNAKPGGYCTSFTGKDFLFDTCAHSLGSCKEGGNINNILKGLNLDNRINFTKFNPSDIFITPDYRISFWSDLNKTINEFQNAFPKEAKNIEHFFKDVENMKGSSLVYLRNKSFSYLLDKYFKDKKLKEILSFPVLGNNGLSASLISAFSALKLFKEFMLDGGYYPKGGMQAFPDLLTKKFKELGGELLLSSLVKKIEVDKGKTVKGIVLENRRTLSAKHVVSNCDITQTFFDLLGSGVVEKEFLNKLSSMVPSLSMLVLYFGLDQNLDSMPKEGTNTWYLPYYDTEKMFRSANKRGVDNIEEYMIHSFSKSNAAVFINAQFEEMEYWSKIKKEIIEEIIKKIEKNIPGLSRHIVYKQIITPYALYKTTLNYKGAAYGWAETVSQFAMLGLAQLSNINNLYFAGHWTTLAQGISGVGYLGKETAGIILRKEGLKN